MEYELNKIYNEDCLQAMRKIPDKYFELAIVDPPYFTGPNKRKYYGKSISTTNIPRKNYPIIADWQVPVAEYFNELLRVSKNQIIWGCNYFNYPLVGGRIIWDKCNGKTSFSDCEIAYCSKIKSVRLFRYMWNGMLHGKSITEGHIMQGNKKLKEKRIHPTQKPVILYEWLLETFAVPGDKILDTYVGSASSIIACKKHGFTYMGFELDKECYDLANKRLLEERKNEYS